MEITDSRNKTIMGAVIFLPFCTGAMLVVLLGALLKDWRAPQLFVGAFFACSWLLHWLIDESPRWLIATGRLDQAKAVLTKAAKANGALVIRSKVAEQEWQDSHLVGSLLVT